MNKPLEFFFDLGSPATYLAYTQLPALCAETGALLVYRPILLGRIQGDRQRFPDHRPRQRSLPVG